MAAFLLEKAGKLGIRVLLCALVAYALWCLLLYLLQDSIIFPRDFIPDVRMEPPEGTVKLWITGEEGEKVEAWYLPPLKSGGPCPVVIFFHGNAELIDFWGSELEKFREWGMGVFLPEFRGYGRSEGFPGQQSISADMHKFYEALIARPDVDPKRIVYFGRSIGTGFACDLSQDHPPAALILMSPFTSLRKMAGRYLAPSFLLKHPLDNEKVVKSSSCPIYIIHGREDTIIPVEHSHRLREVAANCVYREVACGHNDMPMDAEFWQNIHAFLHNNGILEK